MQRRRIFFSRVVDVPPTQRVTNLRIEAKTQFREGGFPARLGLDEVREHGHRALSTRGGFRREVRPRGIKVIVMRTVQLARKIPNHLRGLDVRGEQSAEVRRALNRTANGRVRGRHATVPARSSLGSLPWDGGGRRVDGRLSRVVPSDIPFGSTSNDERRVELGRGGRDDIGGFFAREKIGDDGDARMARDLAHLEDAAVARDESVRLAERVAPRDERPRGGKAGESARSEVRGDAVAEFELEADELLEE